MLGLSTARVGELVGAWVVGDLVVGASVVGVYVGASVVGAFVGLVGCFVGASVGPAVGAATMFNSMPEAAHVGSRTVPFTSA